MVDTSNMQSIIDDFLRTTSGRNLIASAEVADLLLDLRSELENITYSDVAVPDPEPVG